MSISGVLQGTTRRDRALLVTSFALGLLLRLIWADDMEYKRDEEYNFLATQATLHGGVFGGFEWVGMPSGAHIRNPGMSIWVFQLLAKLVRAHDPVTLQHAVSVFAVLGIALGLYVGLKIARESDPPNSARAWIWATALTLVNPITLMYQRKLWPEPFLPFFTALLLWGWFRRDRLGGAIGWGLVGAIIGQVHMSGFFVAAGLLIWTFAFGKRGPTETRRAPRWRGWLLGSALGALPLIPWAHHLLTVPRDGPSTFSGLGELVQLRFYVFWLTDSLGLHVGNPIGLHRGGSLFAQLSDFFRYPIIAGHPTYGLAVAHLGIVVAALGLVRRALARARQDGLSGWGGGTTGFLQNAFLWGYGGLITLTTLPIRRYYLMISSPFEFLWLTRGAASHRAPERLLWALWCFQLAVSAGYVGYVHVNSGSPHGDYGEAFHVVMKRRPDPIRTQ